VHRCSKRGQGRRFRLDAVGCAVLSVRAHGAGEVAAGTLGAAGGRGPSSIERARERDGADRAAERERRERGGGSGHG
jgi:hypothetical protein